MKWLYMYHSLWFDSIKIVLLIPPCPSVVDWIRYLIPSKLSSQFLLPLLWSIGSDIWIPQNCLLNSSFIFCARLDQVSDSIKIVLLILPHSVVDWCISPISSTVELKEGWCSTKQVQSNVKSPRTYPYLVLMQHHLTMRRPMDCQTHSPRRDLLMSNVEHD